VEYKFDAGIVREYMARPGTLITGVAAATVKVESHELATRGGDVAGEFVNGFVRERDQLIPSALRKRRSLFPYVGSLEFDPATIQ
jgi:hypothetical protein